MLSCMVLAIKWQVGCNVSVAIALIMVRLCECSKRGKITKLASTAHIK